MVAMPVESHKRRMPSNNKDKQNPVPPSQTGENTSNTDNAFGNFSHIREALKSRGVPQKACELILGSWRKSTKKQYNTYIDKWISFCGNNVDPFRPNINWVLKFLTQLYDKGLTYRSICLARSAISAFVKICGGKNINESEELTRFLKGVFIARPALPKYNAVWDVSKVLTLLKTVDESNLFLLSCKLSILFLLLSAQRCQTLHLINKEDVTVEKDRVIIYPNHLLKQSKPGHHQNLIVLHAYKKDRKLCIVRIFSEYLRRTEALRTGEKLLISSIKPHKPVSKDTVSRWVKFIMLKAGIEANFKPHSTRAVAVS